MKYTLTIILLVVVCTSGYCQGFNGVAINWNLPSGGHIQAGHNYGFNNIAFAGSELTNDQGWQVMDMDGDGRGDLVVTSQGSGSFKDVFGVGSSPNWKVYLNNGSGFSTSSVAWSLPSGGFIEAGHSHGFNAIAGGGNEVNGSFSWATLDMNGDKKPDLVVTGQGNGSYCDNFNVGSSPNWRVYYNTGSGFSNTATTWALPSGGYISSGHNSGFNNVAGGGNADNGSNAWGIVDINGDSKPDLVVTAQGNGSYSDNFGVGSSPNWKVYYNNGSGFSNSATLWALPSGGYIEGGHTSGFNTVSGGGNVANGSNAWSTADINGDSKPDLIVTAQGSGSYSDNFGVGSSPNWKVYNNTGSGFSNNAIIWTLPSGGLITSGHLQGFNALAGGANTANGSQAWATLDLNGDAKPDLVVTGQGTGSYCDNLGVGSTPNWQVFYNSGTAFATSAITWALPSGGQIMSGHLQGYFVLAGGGNGANGSNAWATSDINGDGTPDLIVTAQGTGSNSDCFGLGSGPYWKVFTNTISSGINTEIKTIECKLYPNPTNTGDFVIEFNDDAQREITITDAVGNIVLKSIANRALNKFNLSGNSAGIYFITIAQNSAFKSIPLTLSK